MDYIPYLVSGNFNEHYDVPVTPERKLLCAVLERAICDLADCTAVNTEQRRSAINWFTSRIQDADNYFTYHFICESLDLPSGIVDKIFERTRVARELEDARVRESLLAEFTSNDEVVYRD